LQEENGFLAAFSSNNLYKARFAFHHLAHHSEIIPIVPQFTQKVGLFDTEKIPYVIEKSERAMQAQLPYLKRFLESAHS